MTTTLRLSPLDEPLPLYHLLVYRNRARPERDDVLHAPDEANPVEHCAGAEACEDVPWEERLGYVSRTARKLIVTQLPRLRRERLYVSHAKVIVRPALLLRLRVDGVPVAVVVYNLSHNVRLHQQNALQMVFFWTRSTGQTAGKPPFDERAWLAP